MVDPKVLAKFYHLYKFDSVEQEHDADLDTPRIKKNLKKIPFSVSFVRHLASLKNGGELAYNYLISVISEDCKALDFAQKNIDTLDIPIGYTKCSSNFN